MYNFKNADFAPLKLALCHIPWESAFLDNDIDVNLLSWQDLFLTYVDQFYLNMYALQNYIVSWWNHRVQQIYLHLYCTDSWIKRDQQVDNKLGRHAN